MPDPALTDAIVLAGGLGSRLKAVVHDRSKPMAEVRGRPFLEWLLLALRAEGLQRVVVATGYGAEQLEAALCAVPLRGLEIVFSREDRPLGTGGAARLALEKARGSRIVVLNGDSFCPPGLAELLEAHRHGAFRVTLRLVRVDDCGRYGAVEVDAGGRVTAFREKAPNAGSGLINAGIYLFEREGLEEVPADQPVSLEREVFPALIGRGLGGKEGVGPFMDIGTPESYQSASGALAAVFDRLA